VSILKEGYPFIFPPLAAGAALAVVSQTGVLAPVPLAAGLSLGLGILLLVFAFFCVFFFRDPSVEISGGENILLSPCNGTVLEIAEGESERIIRVFLSIFNVHLQRAPVDGRVTGVEHRDGMFLMAMNPRAHSLNEQNIITIENERGVFVVRQIAGFLARRCVAWVKSGDTLRAGDKIGLIKFSSQVDLHLPKTARIAVKAGDKVRAGITVMGTV
jgi:phosphatidylserine decarboxylase